MQFAQPNRPGGSYDTFVESCIGFIAMGLGIPPQVITQNWEHMNYSSMRGALLQAREVFSRDRQFLIRNFCAPVFADFVDEMILRGDIRLAGGPPEAYMRARWIPPGHEWVDPLREAKADEIAINTGMRSLTRILAKQGVELDDHIREVAAEREKFEAAGLPAPGSVSPSADVADDDFGDEAKKRSPAKARSNGSAAL